MALARGHVIGLRHGGAGLIWHVSKINFWLVPIAGANGSTRHRADVIVEAWSDIVACGLIIRYPVIHCHVPFKATLLELGNPQPKGTALPGLLTRVDHAIAREQATQSAENHLRPSKNSHNNHRAA
jgi:hypothetical protein